MDEVWEWLKGHPRWGLSAALVGGGLLLILGALFLLRPTQPSATPLALASTANGSVTSNRTNTSAARKSSGPGYVDVKGAVQQPGLYRVTAGMRVADVLEMAKGMLPQADKGQVNLAAKVTDQQVVYVPTKGEHRPIVANNGGATNTLPTKADRTSSSTSATTNHAPVNINTADVAAFQTIKGIGQKKAEKIIAYRQAHGDFQSVQDLKRVGGFGDKTLAKFHDQLTV